MFCLITFEYPKLERQGGVTNVSDFHPSFEASDEWPFCTQLTYIPYPMNVQVMPRNVLVELIGTPSRWVEMNFYRNFHFSHISPKTEILEKCFLLLPQPQIIFGRKTTYYAYTRGYSIRDNRIYIIAAIGLSAIKFRRVGKSQSSSLRAFQGYI